MGRKTVLRCCKTNIYEFSNMVLQAGEQKLDKRFILLAEHISKVSCAKV